MARYWWDGFNTGGIFNCDGCGEKTRQTEETNGTQLCGQCWLDCTMENLHADNGTQLAQGGTHWAQDCCYICNNQSSEDNWKRYKKNKNKYQEVV